MKKPFPAYRGTEPYVFVCYAHSDAARVYADLEALNSEGIKLWYDEGITAGSAWRAEIASAIKGASRFLFFISGASLQSTHCLREIDFALNNDIEIVPVYLDDSMLPGELELALSRLHALFRESDSMYFDHLVGALRDGKSVQSIRPVPVKPKKRTWLPVLGIGVALIFFLFWLQWDSKPVAESAPVSSLGTPNAYDPYLEGLQLLERWDKEDNLETAIKLFGEAISLDPEFALAFARRADAFRIRYALTGDEESFDKAIESANRAVHLNPNLGPVQVSLGRVEARRGNFDLAFAAMERALSIDPNDADANQAIAGLYAKQGRVEDAETSYKKALALDPDNTSVRNSYANFLAGQARFEDAAREWQAVIRLAPDHYAAMVNLGFVLTETGRLAEAITMYQRANEIKPSYMAYSNLGTAYSRSNRYDDAINAYKKALEMDDSDWLAWGNLAYVYSWIEGKEFEAGEAFEKAIQLAEAAKKTSPRDPYIYSDLALYYAKTGQSELSVTNLETAMVLVPDSGEILAAAAEAYEVAGNRDKAVELAQKSLAAGFTRQHLQRNHEMADLLADPRMQVTP